MQRYTGGKPQTRCPFWAKDISMSTLPEETPVLKQFLLQSKEIIFRWCRKSARLATLPGSIPSGYENYSPLTTAAHGHFSKWQWDINTFHGTNVPSVYWTPWKLCPHTRTHPFFLNLSDILTFKSCRSWPHMLIIYFPPLNFMHKQKKNKKKSTRK